MDEKKKIGINAASIVGLKAELFRKQEEFKKERLQNAGSTGTASRPKPKTKKTTIWSKTNAGVESRAEKDKQQLTAEEEDKIAKSQSILAAKAKLYENMMSGQTVPDEHTNERFLVDFEKKAIDKIHAKRDEERRQTPPQDDEDEETVVATVPTREEMMKQMTQEGSSEEGDIPPAANKDEEWVDYVDTLGRSRRCMRKDLSRLINMDKNLNPDTFREQEKKEKLGTETLPDLLSSDMYREMLRKKWETEEEEAAKRGPGPTHYQNVRFDEVREHGVGYFDFSKDETQRQEQMESLQMLRDETLDQRARREQLKAKRKAAMQARLAKVKQRKKLKGEIPGADEEDANVKEEEGKKRDPTEERLARNADKTYDLLMGKGRNKAKSVREWDVGKDSSLWEEVKNKARDERLSEFAPPSIYDVSQSSQGRGQFSRSQNNHEKSWNTKNSNQQQRESSSSSLSSSSTDSKQFQYTYPDTSNATSEADFTTYVPSNKGFQSFQSTKKKPTSSTATTKSNVASSPSLREKLATLRPSASSLATDSPAHGDDRRADAGQKQRTSFMNDEDSIDQSLSFFRMQSQKKL